MIKCVHMQYCIGVSEVSYETARVTHEKLRLMEEEPGDGLGSLAEPSDAPHGRSRTLPARSGLPAHAGGKESVGDMSGLPMSAKGSKVTGGDHSSLFS